MGGNIVKGEEMPQDLPWGRDHRGNLGDQQHQWVPVKKSSRYDVRMLVIQVRVQIQIKALKKSFCLKWVLIYFFGDINYFFFWYLGHLSLGTFWICILMTLLPIHRML